MKYSPRVFLFVSVAACLLAGYIAYQLSWIYWISSRMDSWGFNNLQFYPVAFAVAGLACGAVAAVCVLFYRVSIRKMVPAVEEPVQSKENMKSKIEMEVEKDVDQNELVARLKLCSRIALANIPRSRGDGTFLWQGRLAAYNEILAAVQGDTERLLQFTVVTEENLELAKKLSEQLDLLKSKEVP